MHYNHITTHVGTAVAHGPAITVVKCAIVMWIEVTKTFHAQNWQNEIKNRRQLALVNEASRQEQAVEEAFGVAARCTRLHLSNMSCTYRYKLGSAKTRYTLLLSLNAAAATHIVAFNTNVPSFYHYYYYYY